MEEGQPEPSPTGRPVRAASVRRRRVVDEDEDEDYDYDYDPMGDEDEGAGGGGPGPGPGPAGLAAAAAAAVAAGTGSHKRAHEGEDEDDEDYRQSSSGRSRAKRKDTGSSKRSRSGYMIFLAERGAELRASDPGLVLADVTRKVSRWWKDAPQHERDAYNKRAEEEKRSKFQKAVESARARGEEPPAPPPSIRRSYSDHSYGGSGSGYGSSTRAQSLYPPATVVYGSTITDPIVAAAAAGANAIPNVEASQENLECKVCHVQFSSAQRKREHLQSQKHQSAIERMSETRRIKIFTDEFIEHHRSRESYLRALATENTILEENIKTLSSQATGLQNACEAVRLELESAEAQRSGLLQRFEILKRAIIRTGYPIAEDSKPEEVQYIFEQLNVKLRSASENDRLWAASFAQRLAQAMPGTSGR